MPAIRIVSALIPAVLVTFGLILLMHVLIQSNSKDPEEVEEFKIPEITMDDRDVTEEFDTEKAQKPEEAEEPPPDIPEPEFETPNIDNSLSVKPDIGVKVKIEGNNGIGLDGDYLPIVKVAAKYPSSALQRGIEGYCTVKYTVTTTGETRDVVEHDCPKRLFLRASIRAATKFKYKPKVINGEPIEVPGVLNRFNFELAK